MSATTDTPAIPHLALLLICDGERALLARNTGTPARVRLDVVRAMTAPDNPRSRLQGTDRPGRVMSAGSNRRSSVEAPDLHEAAEAAFIDEAAQAFARLAEADTDVALAVVAPPVALATVRRRLERLCATRDVIQIHKDLTKHPIKEIERILAFAPDA
jgi:protein required for attachment to host cells